MIVVVGVPFTTLYKTFEGLLECQCRAASFALMQCLICSVQMRNKFPGAF